MSVTPFGEASRSGPDTSALPKLSPRPYLAAEAEH